mmetsp:Transcript_43353/g.50955  ORF Transcript_43353/g.50955 Transcript_43353/m.50955 type:complete len:103 (-) Transcript_43353:1018-1326(-)
MNLMNSQMAMIKDPKAIEPRWYLKIHFTPFEIEADPPESAEWVKYQVAAATAKMNWQHPIMNATTQKSPKRSYKNTYRVVLSHFIEANGELEPVFTVPTLQM